MKQMLKRLVAIMIGVAVLFTATPYQHVNAEDGEVVNNPRMTLDSYTTQPGNYAYINLYAYDFVNVMGLEYSIHYDSDVMTLNSYNIGYFVEGSVTNVNDQNVGEIKGSVVNVDGLNGSGQALGMNFYINQEAQPGTYPITLTIGDAYDMELGTVSIAKESGKLVVNEPSSTVKNISFGCYLNNYNVKYDEKVTYTIQAYNVYQLAAGKFEVEYDSEVLALEDVIIADSLITETAIYTIEDERAGLVQITYADIDPIQDWTRCFTLTFSVIKNENTQTEIKFSADNLLDVNLADLTTSTYSNTLSIEEVVYYPTVRIDASEPSEDGTFTADVVFESDTNIAAGDFTVNYNTYEVLCTSAKVNSEVSANGGFVYTKEKIDEGTVFFSYVNTKPVAKEQTILTMTFEPVNEYFGNTVLELKGQDVVNEAYEDITLTYQSANVEVPRPREDIQNLEYYLESYDQYYSGYEIRPYFYFYNGLSEGWDYSLEYSNNVNAGTATLTVTGMNNYKGTITLTFEILPRSINDFYLNLQERYLAYDGTAKFPSVQVDNLVEGRDYTVSYSNNLNVGQGTVTVTGIGNYTGTNNVAFNIVSVSEIILDQEKVVLNEGETKQIKVTVILEDGNTIQDVTWVSLNDSIVSVDNGTITAVSGGITKVQVKAGTKVAELEVTVYCASHTAGEWVVAKEPTVKETGLKVQYCSVCGAVVNEEEIPMLECSHSYSNYISDGNATCMEDGTKTATCDICERETHTIPDEGSKLSHRFVEYVSNKDATYNKNGTETAICANEGCDEEHTREEADSMLRDSVVPSATITIGENSWNTLVKPLIYDLFTTAAFDVTVDAVDNESGVESVEYYVAPAELADVTKVTDWTTYKAFSIDKEGTYVVYVKVTDKQGNVTYISSNGLVIDRTAPVLEGISDGGSYCDGAVVTVNDMFLGSVLINREEVELFNDGFTLTGTEDGTEYAIEAYDRAGNKTSMTVTVFAGHIFEDYHYNGDKTETAECSRGCGATDTRKIRTGWNLVDGEWCYFDQTGKMVCNKWIADSKGWCYVGEDGRMLYNQWVKDSKGYCFVDASGYMVYNKWVHDGNGWAYAGSDGYRQTSKWIKDSVGWCYVGTDGYMVCNDWVADSKDYVYLGESGYMVTNKWIETENGWCYVGSDGYKTTNKWIKKDGNWCYVGADGYLVKNQWVKDSTGWCYLNDEGLMLYNQWVKDSKGWCYVDSSGYMVYSKWVKDDIGWAYAGADGYRVMNKWVKDSIGWCYVDEDGYMLYNQWIADSKGWCFVDGSGYMVYNKWVHDGIGWAYAGKDGYRVMNKWVKDSTGWCYVDENGYMIYNQWVKDSTGYCYVDESGYMVYAQWVEIDGNKYYVNGSGYRVENAWLKIDGNYYYFKEEGVMARDELIGNDYVDENGVWIQ